jgi:hydroxymethylpyrimidine/phosphomethylpyrimidine kinase
MQPNAFKTGMLGSAALVETVAEEISEYSLTGYVLDPVMVATSGDRLLDADAEARLRELLLPLATLVTPNLDEAAILAGEPVRDLEGMHRAAEALVAAGAGAALVKGGHLEADTLVDVFYDGREWREWSRPRIDSTSTHGTGCTLSAAVDAALDFVHRAILDAPGLGHGHGPLNHLVGARRS